MMAHLMESRGACSGRMIRQVLTGLLALLVALTPFNSLGQTVDDDRSRGQAIHNRLSDLISRITHDTTTFDDDLARDVNTRIEELIDASDGKSARVMLETLRYQSRAQNEREAWATVYILDRIMSDLPEYEIVESIAYAMDADDPRFRHTLASALGDVVVDEQKIWDFSHIAKVMESREEVMPDSLVQWMFDRSLEQAMLVMTDTRIKDAELRGRMLDAFRQIDTSLWRKKHGVRDPEMVEGEVFEALQYLAGRSEWWARLCATKIMRQNAELRQTEIVEMLLDDRNVIVQQTMEAFIDNAR